MTDLQALAQSAKHSHLAPKYWAYYDGRNCADFGGKCEFTDETLRNEWMAGYRSVKAEDRLNADTEWDHD